MCQEITHPDMPEAVRRLEAKERPRKYKFGLMLVKEGQTQEEGTFQPKTRNPLSAAANHTHTHTHTPTHTPSPHL
jgi:hypothetical protein